MLKLAGSASTPGAYYQEQTVGLQAAEHIAEDHNDRDERFNTFIHRFLQGGPQCAL